MNKKKELLAIAKEMRDNIENLPQDAMLTPPTHYDLSSLLILLVAWFEEDCKDKS